MIRVLQVISHLATGGAERVAMNLIAGLRECCEFALFAVCDEQPDRVGQSMKSELEQLSVPLYLGTKLPIKLGGMVAAGLLLGRAVRHFRPDLIHLHTEVPESACAAMRMLRPSLKKIPLVRTIHNTVYWQPWRRMGRWCDRRLATALVACVSQGAKQAFEQLRAESGAAPPLAPVELIYNGVVVKGQPRPIGKLPVGQVRILFAGRLEDQKGADLIPAIVRRVQPGLPCRLVIYGRGSHESLLSGLAADPPAGWSIELHPPVPDLSSLMPQFDLMIMPSRYEGLALMPIEATLLGLPVIATDAAGLRENFPPGYPLLARAGDADNFARLLQKALDDPAWLAPAAQQAQDFSRKHFDLDAMCRSYFRLYEQVLTVR